jgi:hypothetical protein
MVGFVTWRRLVKRLIRVAEHPNPLDWMIGASLLRRIVPSGRAFGSFIVVVAASHESVTRFVGGGSRVVSIAAGPLP